MNEILFHSSWWVLACAVIGGIAVFVVGNRRLDKKLQRIGMAIIAIAIILGVLRWFFPNARERMETRSRQIVYAAADRDYRRLASLLSPDTTLAEPSKVLVGGRDAIVKLAEIDISRFNLKSVHILGLDSTQSDMRISVFLQIVTVQDESDGRPVTSTWRMDYEQDGDDWVLQSITLLRLGSDSNDHFNPSIPLE